MEALHKGCQLPVNSLHIRIPASLKAEGYHTYASIYLIITDLLKFKFKFRVARDVSDALYQTDCCPPHATHFGHFDFNVICKMKLNRLTWDPLVRILFSQSSLQSLYSIGNELTGWLAVWLYLCNCKTPGCVQIMLDFILSQADVKNACMHEGSCIDSQTTCCILLISAYHCTMRYILHVLYYITCDCTISGNSK